KQTGSFILDEKTLRASLLPFETALLSIPDRWGQPYKFEFTVVDSNYVLGVWSSGPDRKFSTEAHPSADDFNIWATSIDYFAEHRARLEGVLAKYAEVTKKFPSNDAELRDVLGSSGEQLSSLRDPWGHPYYATFKTEQVYVDQTRIENRATYGESITQKVQITPVTRTVASIALRSPGPDGLEGTADDFSVATFSSTIAEQPRGQSEPQSVRPAVFNFGNGAIQGTVSDSNGARIATATVTARRPLEDKKYQTT